MQHVVRRISKSGKESFLPLLQPDERIQRRRRRGELFLFHLIAISNLHKLALSFLDAVIIRERERNWEGERVSELFAPQPPPEVNAVVVVSHRDYSRNFSYAPRERGQREGERNSDILRIRYYKARTHPFITVRDWLIIHPVAVVEGMLRAQTDTIVQLYV